jgi:hypothetical protein
MRAGRRRSVISVGVLALALAAVPLGAAQAAARDCGKGGGPLSGVTDGLCDLMNGVNDAVHGMTGETPPPVIGQAEQSTGDALGDSAPPPSGYAPPSDSGEHEPPRTPEPDRSPEPPRGAKDKGLLQEVCLPVLPCAEQDPEEGVVRPGQEEAVPAPTGSPRPRHTPTALPSPPVRDRDTAVPPPSLSPTPPESRPQQLRTREQVTAEEEREPAVDADEPRVDLLWPPGPFDDNLSGQFKGHRVIRPSRKDSDVLGTVLTTALLASAILAARVVQQRRVREERAASIPFEPVRANGRHRLA